MTCNTNSHSNHQIVKSCCSKSCCGSSTAFFSQKLCPMSDNTIKTTICDQLQTLNGMTILTYQLFQTTIINLFSFCQYTSFIYDKNGNSLFSIVNGVVTILNTNLISEYWANATSITLSQFSNQLCVPNVVVFTGM